MLFENFCKQINQYYPNQNTFLVAFSGGLDSTVLLSLFAKLREKQPHFQIRAIHIHHGLSKNADYWQQHCSAICEHLKIAFITENVNIDFKNGLESGAREARYFTIKDHLNKKEVLVTAHHQQDQVETFFLALKRGSGLQGLSAMQSTSMLFDMPIFRPLLPFTRQQLETYAEQEKLVWIEDESNQDNQYDRNFLRNQILPELRQRWGHFDEAVQRSAQHCFEQQTLINELLAEDFQKNFNKNDRTFSIENFKDYSLIKQKALLRLWFAEFNLAMPSVIQLQQIIQDVILSDNSRVPIFQLGNKFIRRYQNYLYLTEKFADLSKLKIDIQKNQSIELPDNLGKFNLLLQKDYLLVQWNEYQVKLPFTNLPIQIRFQYSGKVRLKNGINEDIKKCWQRANVPVWERKRTPLIFYGETFISAVGFFNNFVENK
ncbi:tRNA(Ile)-lysidine synthase [Bisgaardia hudsonensis]|uniref:tRNA(Ile)-lysidine synthase n=1 Tax=Bisgaardia hudsonensis TaxID=109472 RepID=A0A4V2SJ77_9PAST|nr:tRNA lysidine(34) synthetase TilS [Bisgaardia hudsonensis]QLB12957.1 tRNA lysidine(34) synthetase TilS [Bisgaardia hudsonensis]TCP13481.1 tRNA(Ile)-lysidine synthase [Bisgaardia hudsonensis]